jgi:hypothetical protein
MALFDDFLPLSSGRFLLKDFFDSFNGLRYPRWGGRRNAVRLENAEARKMLENAAESPASGARCVSPFSTGQWTPVDWILSFSL